jgi:hypothetical protein
VSLFSERRPIPRQLVFEVESSKKLGGELVDLRVIKEGVVREVECHLTMDLNVARSIHEWLDGKIKELEKIRGEAEE